MRNSTEHFYNEIYSYYYSTVGKLINLALKGCLTPEKELEVLYENKNFSDDLVLDKLHVFSEWFLLGNKLTANDGKHSYNTNIVCEYERPISTLEKRWLKSIISNPRIKLFEFDIEDKLSDVAPLFNPEDYVIIGAYNDGDNYDDENYISIFRTILKAIKDDWGLSIISENQWGEVSEKPYTFMPDHIEYSEIEDKFSVYGYSPDEYGNSIIRIGRIKSCVLCAGTHMKEDKSEKKGILTILLNGHSARTQNALERILIEFSHYSKSVKETEGGDYIISIEYFLEEEMELAVMRLMPFAQYIKVLAPKSISEKLSDRINRQIQAFNFLLD